MVHSFAREAIVHSLCPMAVRYKRLVAMYSIAHEKVMQDFLYGPSVKYGMETGCSPSANLGCEVEMDRIEIPTSLPFPAV
jgi:hypothetical protein